MNVGIYNRWLPTLGGGERHSLAIASHLARSHSVDVISHTPLDEGQLAARDVLEPGTVRFRTVPLRDPAELGPLAAKYDLFINASHGDFVPPWAQRNAMLVYFPLPPPVKICPRIRRHIARHLDRLSMQPRFVDGVYGRQEVAGVAWHGLAPTAEIAAPGPRFRPYRLHFSLASADPSVTGVRIDLDGEHLRTVHFARPDHFAPFACTVPPGAVRSVTFTALGHVPKAGIALRMANLRSDSLRAQLYRSAFHDRWPELGDRLQNILPANLLDMVGQYDLLWANSKYTQRWIDAYWHLPSAVLYPPVDVERYAPRSKRPCILSVGRFFAGNHNKKHLVMVHEFRRLFEDGFAGWELHLAGGTTSGPHHEEYLQQVREAAAGLPVHIHTDVPQTQLAELYGTSSIYWHAAGYGESPTEEPEKFEHFGISVVEAMAAGCVPVIVGQGGLTELVRHEHDGYLWYTTDELRAHTRQLARDASLRSRMAQAAMVSRRRFSRAGFDAQLDRTLEPLLGT